MLVFDKNEIKEKLNIDNVFDLVQSWGGEPEYTSFGFVSQTICHNPPGEGSKKLYFYSNNNLFYCYTGCGSFDIFELTIKVFDIQFNRKIDLNEAIRYIAARFGFSGRLEEAPEIKIKDWEILSNYDRIQNIEINHKKTFELKEYDDSILSRFNYNLKIGPWLNEGISQEVIEQARIGFYPGGDQITIPHYDKNNRFIGLRGRTLCNADADLFGKYRPLKINGILYSHPLGYNLYGLNWCKNTISVIEKAIVVESEKSVLKYASYFGWENNICVACCGSSLSEFQVQLLIDAGAKEIVVGLDRQFQSIGDDEFKKLKKNLLKINERFKNYINVSIIFDKNMVTEYKSSPLDEGKEKFLQLFKERIIL